MPLRADDLELSRTIKRVFVWSAGLALVAFLLVQVWLSGRDQSPDAKVKRLMPAIGAELVDQPLTAEQAQWKLELDENTTVTLAQLPRDYLVFVNFWATWCEPCRNELPSMFRLRNELQDKKLIMAAVSYDDSWGDIRAFFMKWLQQVPSRQQLLLLRDPSQKEGHTLREAFGTTAMPDSYLIKNGRIVARFVNARNWVDPSILEYFQQLTPKL